jgi:beta-galactosidase
LRPGVNFELEWNGQRYRSSIWREWVESGLTPVATFDDGKGAIWQAHNTHYLAFWPTQAFLSDYLGQLAPQAGLEVTPLRDGLRIRRHGNLAFAFNYTSHPQAAPAPQGAAFVLGGPTLEPYGLSVWRL